MADLNLPREYFQRVDEEDDPLFYAFPRKVVHIDDDAIAAVRQIYAELLPRGGRLLDLMSSWRSHLPDDLEDARVIGLGLNAEEMADNPQLTDAVVHDINHNPRLPFSDAVFDGAMCAVSVQYMTKPVQVFREVNRVLRPGAPFIVTFSNRCFPTKAIALWRATNDQHHIAIVTAYFEAAGGWSDITPADRSPRRDRGYSDPLYAVWARKTPGQATA